MTLDELSTTDALALAWLKVVAQARSLSPCVNIWEMAGRTNLSSVAQKKLAAAMLGEIHQIAGDALAKESSND